VVGNHDVEALPRLARVIEGLTLLGANGRWGSRVVRKNGRPAVEILGWSFPDGQVRDSPLAQLLRTPLPRAEPGLPRLGLLHADLDAAGGVYAPVSRRELDRADVGAWLLGHIHRPSLKSSNGHAPCGYLGSLVGLDPSETGARGPWLIRVECSGHIVATHLPIAPLRWERLEVAVTESDGPQDVGDRLLDRAEGLAREIHGSGSRSAPRALGIRARLVGATRHYGALRRWIEANDWSAIKRVVGETTVFVHDVSDGLESAVDLRQIARGHDPPALLARKLLALRERGEARRALLDRARARLRPVAEDSCWAPLAGARGTEDPLSDAALASLLEQAGTAALDALLSQGEGVGDEPS